jgi:carboxymethylenebutenolidase
MRGDIRVVLPDEEVAAVVDASVDFLKSQPRVRPDQIAVMGVCQSGRYPIVVGSRRRDLAAVVVLYGAAQESDWQVSAAQPWPMPAMIQGLNAPGLYVFGEADHVISLDDVLRLKGALEAARKSYRMKVFPGMPHGWLNTTMPGRYRTEEAAAAWRLLLDFLGETFECRWPGADRVAWQFESDIGAGYDFSKNVRLE